MRRRQLLIGGLVLPSVLAFAPSPAAADPNDLVLDLVGQTLEMRHVEKATFTMGSNGTDSNHERDEEPAHPVTIGHDFFIGKYPVTREQFAKFVTDTRYVTDAEKGNSGGLGWDGVQLAQKKTATWRAPGFTQTDEHPVVLVSFGDAQAFVGWASRKTGKHVRLPTEAEWELAARAGTTTPWYGGATEAENAGIGWFKSGAGGTRPVGTKKPNAFGIFDMSGDVYEWCRDVYRAYPETAVTDPEVTTPAAGDPEKRVLRGGSWFRDIKRARSGARFKAPPGTRTAEAGFRVVVINDEPHEPHDQLGGNVSNPGADLAPASPVGISGTSVPPAIGSGAAPQAPLASGANAGGHLEATVPEISWTVMFASPLAAASAVVAWMLLRRRRAPAVRIVAPAGVTARLGEDGFFLRLPKATRDSRTRARYEYLVDGERTTDEAPLVGEETYVYTGVVPEALRIIEILGARTRPLEAATAPVAAPRTSRPPPSSRKPPVPSSTPKPPPPMRPRIETIEAEIEEEAALVAVVAVVAVVPDQETVPLVLPNLIDVPDHATAPLVMPGAPVDKDQETMPLVMPAAPLSVSSVPSAPAAQEPAPSSVQEIAPVSVSRVLILDDSPSSQSLASAPAPPAPPSSRPSSPPRPSKPPVPPSSKSLATATPAPPSSTSLLSAPPPSSKPSPSVPPPLPSSKKTLIPASPDLSTPADSTKEPFLGHPRAY